MKTTERILVGIATGILTFYLTRFLLGRLFNRSDRSYLIKELSD